MIGLRSVAISVFFLVCWLALALPSPVAKELPRIAVLKLAERNATEEAEAIAEELRRAFVNSGKYIVIDRTLTDQILKEWATQQSGMTEREKAVKIGKLFNVQWIVSGKVNKFESGGWQISVVMLDAQTGVTKRAETVRHRGDFFSLLDEKLPQVAQLLVEVQASARPPGNAVAALAKPPKRPSGLPRPTRSGAGIKLAVYPDLRTEHFPGAIKKSNRDITGYLVGLIGKDYQNIAITYSYLGRTDDAAKLLKQASWDKGLFGINKPSEKFVVRHGNEMGVDLVLLYSVSSEKKYQYTYYFFDFYLLDVRRSKWYHRSERHVDFIRFKKIDGAFKGMIEEYWRENGLR